MPLDAAPGLEQEALIAASSQLQKRRRAAAKKAITRNTPLKDRRKERASTQAERDRETRAAILEAQAATDKLPANSAYARHRRACLSKALQLLDMRRHERPAQRMHVTGESSPASSLVHDTSMHAWRAQERSRGGGAAGAPGGAEPALTPGGMAAGAACGRAAGLQRGAQLLLRRALCSSAAQQAAPAPVIIVGAGPTGLTLSRLLSQQGVRSLLLERAPALTTHPQVACPCPCMATPLAACVHAAGRHDYDQI